jgi:hypothetical protein
MTPTRSTRPPSSRGGARDGEVLSAPRPAVRDRPGPPARPPGRCPARRPPPVGAARHRPRARPPRLDGRHPDRLRAARRARRRGLPTALVRNAGRWAIVLLAGPALFAGGAVAGAELARVALPAFDAEMAAEDADATARIRREAARLRMVYGDGSYADTLADRVTTTPRPWRAGWAWACSASSPRCCSGSSSSATGCPQVSPRGPRSCVACGAGGSASGCRRTWRRSPRCTCSAPGRRGPAARRAAVRGVRAGARVRRDGGPRGARPLLGGAADAPGAGRAAGADQLSPRVGRRHHDLLGLRARPLRPGRVGIVG